MSNSVCINCGASETDRPLLTLRFQERDVYICPECMPILIHKPQQLVEKLPGMKPWGGPANHDH
jgi:hypothetical protein